MGLEETVELSGRLAAIELLLEEALAVLYARRTPEELALLGELHVNSLRQQRLMKTDDWAMSDLGSDSAAQHVERIWGNLVSMVARLRTSAEQDPRT